MLIPVLYPCLIDSLAAVSLAPDRAKVGTYWDPSSKKLKIKTWMNLESVIRTWETPMGKIAARK